MSSPRETANELIDKMELSSGAQDGAWMDVELACMCATIAVDEIIAALKITIGHLTLAVDASEVQNDIMYWEEVKTEIELY